MGIAFPIFLVLMSVMVVVMGFALMGDMLNWWELG